MGKSPETKEKGKCAGVVSPGSSIVVSLGDFPIEMSSSSPLVRSRFNSTDSPKASLNQSRKSSIPESEFSIPFHAQYRFMLPVTLLLLVLETLIWRNYQAVFCGSLCAVTQSKQDLYFKFAHQLLTRNSKDYGKFPDLKSPAGVIYFYTALEILLKKIPWAGLAGMIPIGLIMVIVTISAYLMRRCRLPAAFLLFWVCPIGLILQGHAMLHVLPETLSLLFLLGALATIISGRYRLSIASLAMATIFDFSTIIPVFPALSLCLFRTLGGRKSVSWSLGAVIFFLLASIPFLTENPRAYLSQSLHVTRNTPRWNPFIWVLQYLEHHYDLPWITDEHIEGVSESTFVSFALQAFAQVVFINYRWLWVDGGVLGFVEKFYASHRGHGIRPTPWTPRETLTVVFESLLLSTFVRFPSLAHPGEFALLSVLISGFFCISLAYPMPMPAVAGLFCVLCYPLSCLYRRPLAESIVANIQYHVKLSESLHFIPMLLFFIAQVVILFGIKRVLASPHRTSLTSSSTAQFKALHSKDHKRSLSQSRKPLLNMK